MIRKILAIGTIIMLAAGGVALAQETGGGGQVPSATSPQGIISPGKAPNTYGVSDYTAYVVPPSSFHPYFDALGLGASSDGYVYPQSSDSFLWYMAPVYLPTGALLANVAAWYYDGDTTGNVEVQFAQYACPGDQGCTETDLVTLTSDTSGAPGYATMSSSGAHGTTWLNFDQSNSTIYTGRIYAHFSEASSTLKLGPVLIWYCRQISPAPATATFDDVPVGSFGFQQVEALAASGITAGCDSNNFCPNSPVTRVQMAVYLSKALGLHWADWHY